MVKHTICPQMPRHTRAPHNCFLHVKVLKARGQVPPQITDCQNAALYFCPWLPFSSCLTCSHHVLSWMFLKWSWPTVLLGKCCFSGALEWENLADSALSRTVNTVAKCAVTLKYGNLAWWRKCWHHKSQVIPPALHPEMLLTNIMLYFLD